MFTSLCDRLPTVGGREQGTGNREQGTGNREQGTVFITSPSTNQKLHLSLRLKAYLGYFMNLEYSSRKLGFCNKKIRCYYTINDSTQ